MNYWAWMETKEDVAKFWGLDLHVIKYVEVYSVRDDSPRVMEFVGLTNNERGDWCACVRQIGTLDVEVVHPSRCKPWVRSTQSIKENW